MSNTVFNIAEMMLQKFKKILFFLTDTEVCKIRQASLVFKSHINVDE